MPKKVKSLSPIEYSAKYSIDHIRAMCAAAGTNYDYWKRIRDRRQRPSVDLATALVESSCGELDLMSLLFKREHRRGVGAPRVGGGPVVAPAQAGVAL